MGAGIIAGPGRRTGVALTVTPGTTAKDLDCSPAALTG